ncbi:hypothetical protein [Amycolatopsis sp. PS_44_ISF1]|uniref:hypothetical protein n=1 Tax=Amycolatopsis sp. PS_44_ISF1 TaxID=2974917 RepID=UPI0028DE9E64|nr:hypothetical protein [Amycolatopsis sp. PS_44_ISF1]MDT8915744.1 hypothetical protein [Amycolatopsis sp. PS_44_ISF1]
MTNALAETTQTLTYVTKGFTDDVTECEICGREELKGTVRLEITAPDGDVEGEVYAGVSCAGRRAGRPAAVIRSEAKAHETAVRAAWSAYRAAQHDAHMAASTAALGRLGLERRPRNLAAVDVEPGYVAEMAAWEDGHPAPERPRGW